jgi:signal peptidase I
MSLPPTTATPDVPASAPDPEPGPDSTDSGTSRARSLIEWVVVIAGALIVALLIKTFLIQAFYIPSESMVPELAVGDRVLVNKLSYKLHDVNRGDLVVFERPEGEPNQDVKDLIKRVVALPGEEVVIEDNSVWIDGERLDESYLPTGTVTKQGTTNCTTTSPCAVPEGSIWVMGDNREHSFDSRYFGPIEEDTIVGRAFLRIWPFGEIGFL